MRSCLTSILLALFLLGGCTDWPRGAAERGDAEAQYNLGVMYENGRGYPRDLAEAARWYGLAAEQGYMDAQYNLGSLYADGEGVEPDPARASHWYRLAADQGLREAQHDLAVLYDLGQGIERDTEEASRLYTLAAEQGLVDAMFNLAILQLETREYDQAIHWFSEASQQGDDEAQLALARMYERGYGVERNLVQAYLWANRAHHNDNDDALETRQRVTDQMSEAEYDEAVRLSFDR